MVQEVFCYKEVDNLKCGTIILMTRKKKTQEELDAIGLQELPPEDQALVSYGVAGKTDALVKMRDGDKLLIPNDAEIEGGTRILAGELLNDAFSQMHDDRELEGTYDSDELMRRKMYIVNVLAHVTKMTQGKEKLRIESNKEKRETANFFVDLLDRAAAGSLSEADIADMEAMQQSNNERTTAEVT